MHHRTFALSAVLTLCAASVALAQDMDTVYIRGSQPRECVVQEMNFKEVKGEDVNGIVQPTPTKDVERIEFGPGRRTFDFTEAENKFHSGDFAEAREKYERVTRDSRASAVIKQVARFMIVQCSFEMGEWDKAIEQAKRLRADVADTFYMRDTFVVQFNAARSKGSIPEAEAAIKEFEAAAGQHNVAEWTRGSGLLKAELAETKKDWRAARTEFERFSTDRDPQIATDARLGLLRTLSSMGDWATLSARADTYISDFKTKVEKDRADAPWRLGVAAYLAKGKALLHGEKKNKQALLELVRASLDIAPKAGLDSPEKVEALSQAVIACSRLAAEQTTKEGRDQYRERAHELIAELKRLYSAGPLLDSAVEEVKKIPR